MKTSILIAAAMAAGVAMAPIAASADPGQTSVTRTTVVKTENNRRYDGGRRWHWKTVCTTKWKNGRKWRQCRKVRTRW